MNNIKKSSSGIPPKTTSEFKTVLIDTLSPHVGFKSYPKGQRIPFQGEGSANCYIIREGIVTVSRQPDDLLLGVFAAPSIRGVIAFPDAIAGLYTLKVIQAAEMAVFSHTRLYELLTSHELWETYARHLQLMLTSASEQLVKLVPVSAYEMIRLQLFELMAEPASVRDIMTAEMYIRSRTMLSRSSIMRILSELKAGGYIISEGGHLKSIISLPERY